MIVFNIFLLLLFPREPPQEIHHIIFPISFAVDDVDEVGDEDWLLAFGAEALFYLVGHSG